MLLRLITVISLITLLLLLISGAEINVAIYRSLLVFLVLFTIMYLTIFLTNVIKENPDSKDGSSSTPSVSAAGNAGTSTNEK
ncbi:MAG: hypothetical protein LAT84_07250 [Balneolia bacterium]|nr:hypothetical protein [Balneolia bacterium]